VFSACCFLRSRSAPSTLNFCALRSVDMKLLIVEKISSILAF
jgi:hypothetical protein